MASRGKKVGEAIVRVAPDANNFQEKLRNEIISKLIISIPT